MEKNSYGLFSIVVIIIIILSAVVIFVFDPIIDGENRNYISVKNYTEYVSYGNYYTFAFKGKAWHTYKIGLQEIESGDDITDKFSGEKEVKTDIQGYGTFKLKLTSHINQAYCYPYIYYDDNKFVDNECLEYEFTVE